MKRLTTILVMTILLCGCNAAKQTANTTSTGIVSSWTGTIAGYPWGNNPAFGTATLNIQISPNPDYTPSNTISIYNPPYLANVSITGNPDSSDQTASCDLVADSLPLIWLSESSFSSFQIATGSTGPDGSIANMPYVVVRVGIYNGSAATITGHISFAGDGCGTRTGGNGASLSDYIAWDGTINLTKVQ
jgi:hypothetical protein